MDFLHGARIGKPVEGLRAQHGIEGICGKRNRFGSAGEGLDIGELLVELGAYLLDRLECGDVGSGGDQVGQEIAGAVA